MRYQVYFVSTEKAISSELNIFLFMRVRKIAKSDYQLRRLWPSVRKEQLGSHCTDLNEISYLRIFFPQNLSKTIQVPLKSNKHKGHFTWRPIYILYHISLISSYNEIFFPNKSCREIQNTHFVSSPPSPKIAPFMRKFEKNIAERGRPQTTTWRMGIACWIRKATKYTHTHTHTHTHTGCVIPIAFPHTTAPQCYVIVRCLSCYDLTLSDVTNLTSYRINKKCKILRMRRHVSHSQQRSHLLCAQ